MAKTRHIQTRMNQRGIDQQLVALARDFGKTVERDGAQRHMLTRKGVDATLKRLDRLRGSLLKARDKGGVVLVDGHDGVEITAYRLNSYRRSGGKR